MTRHRLVDSATWKAAPEAERSALALVKAASFGALALTKAQVKEVKDLGGDPERTLSFTLSDEGRDRDKDRINQSGWGLKDFAANPVVLWAHKYDQPPVGKALKTWVGNSTDKGPQLKALKQFTRPDENPFGAMTHALCRGGYLNACSVGFIPTEHEQDTPQKGEPSDTRVGLYFKSAQLLESSIVPVPSNPRALHDAKSVGGIDLAPYVEWCERALDEHNGTEGLWVPRSVLEEARVVAKGARTIIFTPAPESSAATAKAAEPAAPTVPGAAASDPSPTTPSAASGRASSPALTAATEACQRALEAIASEQAAAPIGQRAITVGSPEEALACLAALADYLFAGPELSPEQAMRIDNAIDLADGAIDLILDALGAPDPGDDDDGEERASPPAATASPTEGPVLFTLAAEPAPPGEQLLAFDLIFGASPQGATS